MRRFLTTILIIGAISTSVYSYDWSANGYTVSSTSKRGGMTVDDIKSTDGDKSFSVSYKDTLNDKIAKKIIDYVGVFNSWENITGVKLLFMVKEKTIDISVHPNSVLIDSKESSSLIPGGMLFYYDNATSKFFYDFRMLKDKVFVRIKGLYITEVELLKTLSRAAANPNAFIKRNDPDYYHAKLEELEQERQLLNQSIFELRVRIVTFQNRSFFGKIKPVDRKVISKVISLKKKNPKWKKAEIEEVLKNESLKFGRKDVQIILGVFYGEFD